MNIITAPTLSQIGTVVEWLTYGPHQNPDLECVLSLILSDRLPLDQGELLAIAHTATALEPLTSSDIGGVLIAAPENKNVSLAGCDQATTEALLSLIRPRGCPQRIATSIPSRDWVRPRLLEAFELTREYTSLIMLCTEAPVSGQGRWATFDDIPTLQASAEANQVERRLRPIQHNWPDLIQRQQVAVLEHEGRIVSVIKRSTTPHYGMIVGAFTFAPFRRQGLGKRLLAFVLYELFQEMAAVKLWVDDDNGSAIALYTSLGFRAVGSHYTGYYSERSQG